MNEKVARRILERLGHRVDSVKDGREAVNAWRTGRTKPIDRALLVACIGRFVDDRQLAEKLDAPLSKADEPVAAAIDISAVRSLVGGDMHFGRELLDAFIASSTDRLQEIRDALTDNDIPRLTRAAHAVKGAGASMHAEEVRTVAARLESAAQAGTNQSLAQLVKDLSQAIERAIAQLRPLCSGAASSSIHGSSTVAG